MGREKLIISYLDQPFLNRGPQDVARLFFLGRIRLFWPNISISHMKYQLIPLPLLGGAHRLSGLSGIENRTEI